jgi:hypothetical protein
MNAGDMSAVLQHKAGQLSPGAALERAEQAPDCPARDDKVDAVIVTEHHGWADT